jgi:hypothetical protein
VAEVLAPELKRGDVVIWDNLKPHQSEAAVEAVEAVGARVAPLPPWSPDLTPIEKDQTDSTSSDRWYEATGAGYHRRRRAA